MSKEIEMHSNQPTEEKDQLDNAKPLSLFRSREMSYVSIVVPDQIAPRTMAAIGEFGKLHPVDLSQQQMGSQSKQYLYLKKRLADCGFWERKLQWFIDNAESNHVVVPRADPDQRLPYQRGDVLSEIKTKLEPLENDLKNALACQIDIRQQICRLEEGAYVLDFCRRHREQEFKLVKEYTRADAASPSLESDALVKRGSEKKITDSLIANESTGASTLSSTSGSVSSTSTASAPSSSSSSVSTLSVSVELPVDRTPSKIRQFLTGTIPNERIGPFKRTIYRLSRGIAVCHFWDIPEPIPDPNTNEMVSKSVFYIMVVSDVLINRIRKACPLFNASVFSDVPDKDALFETHILQMKTELDDKRNVLTRTDDGIHQLLSNLANFQGKSPIREWEYFLHCEKAITDTLMKCQFASSGFVLEGWVPKEDVGRLHDCIVHAAEPTDSQPATMEVNPKRITDKKDISPPTYFETNKFSSSFQGIVNTYGFPRYGEVNPGLFVIITFPFLFGVMYGDIGHGVLLTVFSLLMVLFEKPLLQKARSGELNNEIFLMAFGGRYLLLAMGFAAIFCGIIYNDCMSVPTAVYGSSWEWNEERTGFNQTGVYPIGLDYRWFHKNNGLTFINSLKMKLSVLLGVTQMVFGLVLSFLNHMHVHDYVSVFLEWLPQMIFMLALFGYMDFMIIYKFCVDWTYETIQPPPLIQTMIQMFLSVGSVAEDKQLFPGQGGIQAVLVVLAVFSVPVMLLGKPLMMKWRKNHQPIRPDDSELSDAPPSASPSDPVPLSSSSTSSSSSSLGTLEPLPSSTSVDKLVAAEESKEPVVLPAHHTGAGGAVAHEEEEETFGNVMIHQAIHTIEYVLAAISNTASYLRLWALSLAHMELAEVFWNKLILQYGVNTGNPAMIVVGFAVWLGATVGVLCCMDVLECFLHALRLHWVEMMGKHFLGDGYAFQPFTFHSSDIV
eukprot:TRINITY_DN486_c0_g1_i1.p1 TRINITY_DN486_c0_g1~~TRINITY_DN486_c0_g1_i1.p1  ORF type:complete len:951 (-),score=292.71 TRINITY_DN486_c0_g1_i1:134-2986(-)